VASSHVPECGAMMHGACKRSPYVFTLALLACDPRTLCDDLGFRLVIRCFMVLGTRWRPLR
jgi:hypothetical protein